MWGELFWRFELFFDQIAIRKKIAKLGPVVPSLCLIYNITEIPLQSDFSAPIVIKARFTLGVPSSFRFQ